MKGVVNFLVAGVISAAMMVMLKLLLSQQAALAAYHYPAFSLEGRDGLQKLGFFAAYGAGYGAAYGLLLRSLLPGGLISGSLALGVVPTLVSALFLPLYKNESAIRDPWILVWLYAHWAFYSLCLVFIAGKKGGGSKKGDEE